MASAVMQAAGTRSAVHWKSLRTSVVLSRPELMSASAPHLNDVVWIGRTGGGGGYWVGACDVMGIRNTML